MNRTQSVNVIGAGGHAKVVVSALGELGYAVQTIFDDDPRRWGSRLLGIPVTGPVDRIAEQSGVPAVIAVGDNDARRALAERLCLPWLTVVDRHAVVDPTARLGAGTVVLRGAVIQPDAVVGDHAIVNTAASIDHDCRVGDYAHLAPGVRLAGNVSVGDGALLGVGAVAAPGVSIGARAVVGAGAAAVRDVPAAAVAVGVPAKTTRLRPHPDRGAAAPATTRVYLSPPHMSPVERELLLEAFDSNWIAPLGPHVDALEKEFAGKVGAREAVALSSGTAALHLALLLLGVGRGDEVLTSTLTFAATANAISYVGATPVFIDSDRATWNIDPDLLAKELRACARRRKMPKALIAVDLYGQCADYGPIVELCRRYDVPLVEDAAEALGASYDGRAAGTLGAIGCFSFNGNKIITTSGGGMLVSDNVEYARRARFLATQARDAAPHYEHSQIGYNYRMSNLLAAVGRGQLRVLDERVEQRRANFDYYRETLAGVPGIAFMPEHPRGRATRWLTCITVDPQAFGATAEDIRLALEEENIEARPAWKPMHLQPVFSGCRARGGAVAEELFRQGLCLPSGSNLAAADRSRVSDCIRALHARRERSVAVPRRKAA